MIWQSDMSSELMKCAHSWDLASVEDLSMHKDLPSRTTFGSKLGWTWCKFCLQGCAGTLNSFTHVDSWSFKVCYQ